MATERTLALIYDFNETHKAERETLRKLVCLAHGVDQDTTPTPGRAGQTAYLIRIHSTAELVYRMLRERLLKNRELDDDERLYVLDVSGWAGEGDDVIDGWADSTALDKLIEEINRLESLLER